MMTTIRQKIKKYFQGPIKKEKMNKISTKQTPGKSIVFCTCEYIEIKATKTMLRDYYQLYHSDASHHEQEKQLEIIIQKINEFRITNDDFMTKQSKNLLNRFENAIKLTLQNLTANNLSGMKLCEDALQMLIN
jgi:hypothetical protein